jgi:hypothetical protein
VKYGKPLPPAILNKPILKMGLGLYYEGFLDLCSTRSEPGRPISYLAMMDYCRFWEFDYEQCEAFTWFVSRLDSVYLAQEK